MESLAGSGHKYATLRPKLGEKLDQYKFDPLGRFPGMRLWKENALICKGRRPLTIVALLFLKLKKKSSNLYHQASLFSVSVRQYVIYREKKKIRTIRK